MLNFKFGILLYIKYIKFNGYFIWMFMFDVYILYMYIVILYVVVNLCGFIYIIGYVVLVFEGEVVLYI